VINDYQHPSHDLMDEEKYSVHNSKIHKQNSYSVSVVRQSAFGADEWKRLCHLFRLCEGRASVQFATAGLLVGLGFVSASKFRV
jgi:hypothetical protein